MAPAFAEERDFDPLYSPGFRQIFGQWKHWRILFNVTPLLTLGIMGGAILPVPSSFAGSGLLSSSLSMVVIAACMIYTCDLLLWQSLSTGMRDYETLSQAIGGRWYRIFTECWLVILMIGTLISSIVQVGETCASGILFINPNFHNVLVNGSGRIIMVIAVICMSVFVFAKSYRSLELVGDFGFLCIVTLVIVIMVHAIETGLPAYHNGQFAKIGFTDLDSFGTALSTFGFMFYLQPVLMPVASEMPPGAYGVRLLQWAARLAIGGTAFIFYYAAGFFGAAAFGNDIEGNVLENNLGGNGKAQGALNIIFSLYIAFGCVPFEYACRHAVESLLIQAFPRFNQKKYDLTRTALEGFIVYGLSLGIALIVPGQSANIIAVTGATGVLVVCYAIPCINHYILFFGRAKIQRDPSMIDQIIKPQKRSDSESTASSIEPTKTYPHHDYGAEQHISPEWNQPGALTMEHSFPYHYTTLNKFWRIFHMIAPIIACCVGAFASVLTLKEMANSG